MYATYEKVFKSDDPENVIVYGVCDETKDYPDFTTDRKTAEFFAKLLNDNEVEPVHVKDIIEDMFY